MCIVTLLKATKVSEDDFHIIKNDLLSWPELAKVMSTWEKAEEVLPYLKVEIQSRARMYYINRLYGRWRKLLPREDWPKLHKYIKEAPYRG